jgi:hypothetical protein
VNAPKQTPGNGEQARHLRQAELLVAVVQKARDVEFGKGRGMHRKPIVGLPATFTVSADEIARLPVAARAGLFQKPGTYKAIVRLSNGSPQPEADSVPGIRGFAIKVYQNGDDGKTQDFVLINQERQFVPTSDEFVAVVLALDQFGKIGGSIAYLLQDVTKFLKRFGYIATLFGFLNKPFSGFASEEFFSAAPIRCGESAVRVRLKPPHPEQASRATPNDLRDATTKLLATEELKYEFQLQLFDTEQTTPIEDASVDWPTDYTTVATLTIQKGAAAIVVEQCSFDPWNHDPAHEPVGEMMRSRRVAYDESRKARTTGACPFSAFGSRQGGQS